MEIGRMYKRILVPVDGSPTANRGLKEALRLAKAHRARLCLLHVVEEFFVAQAGEAIVYAEEMFDALKASGRKVLARAQAAAKKSGVPARTVLVESIAQPVADVIVRQARRFKADLIVLGTHGRRGVRRVVLGSDAEQVVRLAQAPVLLVRAPGSRR
jgi:nucleotide-binding universal stress UspA family protein